MTGEWGVSGWEAAALARAVCTQSVGVRSLHADGPCRGGAHWEAEGMADSVRRLSGCLFLCCSFSLGFSSPLVSLGHLPPHPFFFPLLQLTSTLLSSPSWPLTPFFSYLLVPNPSVSPASPPPSPHRPPALCLSFDPHPLPLLLVSVSLSVSFSVGLPFDSFLPFSLI